MMLQHIITPLKKLCPMKFLNWYGVFILARPMLKHGKQLIENFKVRLYSHVIGQWSSQLVQGHSVHLCIFSNREQQGGNKGFGCGQENY
jgi:hypothetical protein